MKRYDKIRYYFSSKLYIVIPLIITGLLYNGLMCIIPRIEGDTINSLIDLDTKIIIRNIIIFLGIILFVQINRFFKRYLVRDFSVSMQFNMRKKSFDFLLNSDMSYFENHKVGDILNRNLGDIYDTCEGVRKVTTEVFDTFVLLFGYIISLLLLDYKLALIGLLFCGLSILVAHFMKKYVYKANKDYKEYLSINKEETLILLKNEIYYRGYGVHNRYQNKYDSSIDLLKNKSTKALALQSSMEPIYNSIALIGTLFIIYFGGKNVIDGVYQIGVFSSILTTYILIARKSSKVGKLFNAYQGFKISWNRVLPFLHDDIKKETKLINSNEELILKDFSIEYDTFKLPKINITIKKNERIAVCGKVHTGKSTFLQGLTGLYKYNGEARLFGNELYKNNLSISYLSSQSRLYNDTLRNNITLNKEGDLNKALSYSMLDKDFNDIGGLDTVVGYGISNISGGQEKRLMLARSIYNEGSLMILDNPLESVDSNMASEILNNLFTIPCIIIMSTNNVNLLKKFDRIIYLDYDNYYCDTFDNLLSNNGFKELVNYGN